MDRPRLLDLFCGAGGCSMGYNRAGFDVTGVDINPQPRYPFTFIQADVMTLDPEFIRSFDAVHASPPCQKHSRVSGKSIKAGRREYPCFISPVRDMLALSGLPYIIENVEGSPLRNPFMLCGSMFGLDVRRHRLFESNIVILSLECRHDLQTPRFRTLDSRRRGRLASVIGVHGHLNYPGEFELRCKAMGIDWMNNQELTQAIPPAYTEFIGKQLINYLRSKS
jgi:DNA (cytosine-5)-methyltransferase 1